MRIIAGKHRSRVLKEFSGRDIRPTSDRAKEALFNILQTRIYGSKFLDLFAGTGNIGLEALSRGAEKAVLVDNSKESVKLCAENAAMLKEEPEIVFSDARTFVNTRRGKFDIIFLDPPYKEDATDIVDLISERGLLEENGVIIYERRAGENLKDPEKAKKTDERRYGVAEFTFYGEKI